MGAELLIGDGKTSNGNSRDKWLLGSVVSVALLAAATLGVMGVVNGSAEAMRKANVLETQLAVMKAQTEARGDETNRRLEAMERSLERMARAMERRSGANGANNQ
jgi:hypothetical protein